MSVMDSAEESPGLRLFQFGRFLIVGGMATAIQYAILLALTGAGIEPLPASSFGFAASALANYTLNRRFTFHSEVKYVTGLERFSIIAGVGLALNAVIMAAGIRLGLHYVASQIVATAIVLLWNFQINRLWTFSHRLDFSRGSRQEIPPFTGSYHDQDPRNAAGE